MENNDLKEQFALYLFAIKQAFEGGKFSDADCDTLSAIFEHAMLYRSVLDNESICDANMLEGILAFCKLIEEELPAPEILTGAVLHLELVRGHPYEGGLCLPGDLRACADKLFHAAGVDLMSIFQCAILDLSAKLKTLDSLSKADIENTNYVLGMAEITSINFGAVIGRENNIDEFNNTKIHKFFVDAVRFAGSLRVQGLGLAG